MPPSRRPSVPGSKTRSESVRTWIRGLALAPQSWSPLIEDEHIRPVVTLFVGFMDVEDPEFDPAVIILREPVQFH
jgi:hypothetical protein